MVRQDMKDQQCSRIWDNWISLLLNAETTKQKSLELLPGTGAPQLSGGTFPRGLNPKSRLVWEDPYCLNIKRISLFFECWSPKGSAMLGVCGNSGRLKLC